MHVCATHRLLRVDAVQPYWRNEIAHRVRLRQRRHGRDSGREWKGGQVQQQHGCNRPHGTPRMEGRVRLFRDPHGRRSSASGSLHLVEGDRLLQREDERYQNQAHE